MSRYTTSQNSRAKPAHAGGVRNGRVLNFSQFDSSSDEEISISPAERLTAWCEEPLFRAMREGGAPWGDIVLAMEDALPVDLDVLAASAAADRSDAVRSAARATTGAKRNDALLIREANEEIQRYASAESSLWRQPWAENLELRLCELYDLEGLTDEEYEAMMTWLYAEGWEVSGNRWFVNAWPADLPPRTWVSERDFHVLAPVAEEPVVVRPKKKSTVPRFCRASSGGVACADPTCRYVHDDTMHRLDELCAFGESCGASDPAKRALCIRMHPGELWTPALVVRRP